MICENTSVVVTDHALKRYSQRVLAGQRAPHYAEIIEALREAVPLSKALRAEIELERATVGHPRPTLPRGVEYYIHDGRVVYVLERVSAARVRIITVWNHGDGDDD